jgi:hypothetical protein
LSNWDGLLDHVSDWFKILLKSGIPAFLIGLGWLLILIGSLWFGENPNAAFWVDVVVGFVMVVLGVVLHRKERLENPQPIRRMPRSTFHPS